MSGTITTGFRRRILDQVFRGVALPASLQIALTRKVPSANSSVSQLDEPTGMAYGRVTVPLADASAWAMTLSGEAATNSVLLFPTATGTWGVMTGWAAVTVEATPIVALVGQLVVPYRVVAGIRPRIPLTGLAVGLYD